LEAEIERAEDRRETRLRNVAGEAALRLLFQGDDEERAWMRARLARPLDEADTGDAPGGAAWLEDRWARRAKAAAALEEVRAARRKKAARAFGNQSDGPPAVDGAGAGSGDAGRAPLATGSGRRRCCKDRSAGCLGVG
jgi:hypothetical protein